MEKSVLCDDSRRPLLAGGLRWRLSVGANPLPLFLAVPALAVLLALADPRVMAPPATGLVHDMRGQTVPVTLPARRVVIYPPVFWAYLTVDGGPTHTPAAAAYQKEEIRQGLLHQVFPAAADLPDAATLEHDTAIPGDPERILALKADAILSWSQFSGALTKIGAPVVQLDLKPTGDGSEPEAMWRLMGRLAGKPERAEALIARSHREWQRVLAALAGTTRHPRVLYAYQTAPLLVAFGGTREARLLDAVGADNVASGLHGPTLGKEQLLELAPDVIILAGFADGNTVRTIQDDPALRGLPAVRAGRVYRQPTGGARMEGLIEDPLMLQWLAEVIHPETAPRRFRQDLKTAYAEVYGVALSDEAIDQTLHFDENAGASGFDRFRRVSLSSPRKQSDHVARNQTDRHPSSRQCDPLLSPLPLLPIADPQADPGDFQPLCRLGPPLPRLAQLQRTRGVRSVAMVRQQP